MGGTSPTIPSFSRYIGIDYSGAETPNASLKGLRVYLAEDDIAAVEVQPPPSPRKYWTRRGIAEWLTEPLAEDVPTLVGIDHGFSFPLRYFEVHRLKPDWPTFLDDFQRHWPTDENVYVDFVRDGVLGNGAARMGHARWRRLTEERSGSAKSVLVRATSSPETVRSFSPAANSVVNISGSAEASHVLSGRGERFLKFRTAMDGRDDPIFGRHGPAYRTAIPMSARLRAMAAARCDTPRRSTPPGSALPARHASLTACRSARKRAAVW